MTDKFAARANGQSKPTHAGQGQVLPSVLYRKPVPSTRRGSIFNAHAYPTKINAEAVIPFIVAHTKPGDLVFDGFAGSGPTGLAICLCGDPSHEIREPAEDLVGTVAWGSRRCELYDISKLAAFISSTLIHPPDPNRFAEAAKQVLANLAADWGWLYEAQDDDLATGSIRHTLWTDYPICPCCGSPSAFWDLAVVLSPPAFSSRVRCPHCKGDFDVASADRVVEDYFDELLEEIRSRRLRRPVFLYGRTGNTLWKRPAKDSDLQLAKQIEGVSLPSSVPVVPMLLANCDRWGELYRAGYHFGITHLHHFYTRRNLIAVGSAWKMADSFPEDIRNALRFWISSYNASHSTLMTRVVCKKSAKDLVVTSAQPGALYVSSLPVEKNVIAGLRAKLRPIIAAFDRIYGRGDSVSVHNRSSLNVHLGDSTVDYIFADPPFGDNIQYSEVNFISEAWLGDTTSRVEEVVASRNQGKSVNDYQQLLTRAFSESFRILKPGHFMTVVFHSTRPVFWEALRRAWEMSGFQMVGSGVLDKTQSSFKQTTTKGAVKGDPLILLRKPLAAGEVKGEDGCPIVADEAVDSPWDVIRRHLSSLEGRDDSSTERTRQRLYSYLISYYLEHGRRVPLNASQFFAGLDQLFEHRGGAYYIK